MPYNSGFEEHVNRKDISLISSGDAMLDELLEGGFLRDLIYLLILLGLTIDLSKIYRKLKKSEETAQKIFKNYIPQVNKRIMITVLISFVVFSALSFISFLIVFPIIISNLFESIIYSSQFVFILTSFIILYRNIKSFPDFKTKFLDEKES